MVLEAQDCSADFVAAQLRNSERSLLVISIPHAAAFGALLSRYDLDAKTASVDTRSLPILIFFVCLPLTAWWLAVVHDQLRSTFLMAGYMGRVLSIKHGIRLVLSLLFPMLIVGLAASLSTSFDTKMLGYIGLTLLVWWGCAWWVSTILYLRMAKSLGVSLGE